MAQMAGNHTSNLRTIGLVMLLSLSGACLWSAKGADRIRFSTSSGTVALPGGMDTNKEIEKLYNSIEKKSPGSELQGGVLTPPSPGTGVVNNRRLQDLIDQRKNWIFVTPGMALENMNDRLIGKKSGEVNGLDSGTSALTAKPKTTVERFWSRQENTQNNPVRTKRDEADDNNESASSLQPASSMGPLVKPRRSDAKLEIQNANRYLDAVPGRISPVSVPGVFGNVPGTTDPMLGKGFDNLVNNRPADQAFFLQKQSRDEIRQWLRPGQSSLPVSGPNDPINFFPDLTRREMQPVTAKTAEEYSTDNKLNPNGPIQNATSLNLRPSLLDNFSDRSAGQSSLTPAMVSPASSVFVQPQPSILEMPKRRF